MHLRRDFQAQCVEPDEAGGVVLVVSPAQRDRVGFHRGNHDRAGAEFTSFSSVWLWLFVPPCQRENRFRASAVRAAVAADQECPSRAAALR